MACESGASVLDPSSRIVPCAAPGFNASVAVSGDELAEGAGAEG
jgi:hypothetical protein